MIKWLLKPSASLVELVVFACLCYMRWTNKVTFLEFALLWIVVGLLCKAVYEFILSKENK